MVARNKLIFVIFLFILSCRNTENEPPRVLKARFCSERFTVEGEVQVNATIASSLPSTILYKWSVNGFPIQEINSPILPSYYFHKNDIITCEVFVKDIRGRESVPFNLKPITIENSPPRISWADFSPNANIQKGMDISIIFGTKDPDDDEVSLQINWYLDEKLISSNSILDGNLLESGKILSAEIIPYDGEEFGDCFKLPRRIIVQNLPPKLTGTFHPVIKDTIITCKIDVQDPDGDKVTCSIEEGPHGMTIDDKGIIQWRRPEIVKDTIYTIVIKAIDSKGAKSTGKFKIRFSIL